MFANISILNTGYIIISIILLISIIYHLIRFQSLYNDTAEEKAAEEKKDDSKEKDIHFYIKTAHMGFLRGAASGFLLGDAGILSVIRSGAASGILGPLFTYIGG